RKRTPFDLRPPLQKTWHVDLEPLYEWLLRPFPDPGTGEEQTWCDPEGRCFFARGRRIACRNLSAGQTLWTTELAFEANRFGLSPLPVIAASQFGIAGLNLSDGKLLWQFLAPDPPPMPAAFPEPVFRTLAPPREPLPLSAFRLAGSRLFAVQNHSRLLA